MGLIRAAKDAVSGLLADQWREYFYCDSLSEDVLVVKGNKRVKGGRNNKGNDNIISNGSVIAVNEGQCMIIVEQGEIVEFSADAGEFVYDTSTEPSLFTGELGENLKTTFKQIGKRFAFGGVAAKDQRVYYFNIKENMGNLFGTPTPIPFRVVDANIGLDVDISIRCNGEYSFRICDPLLFYKNVSGNVSDYFERSSVTGMMKSELLTALQPAFAQISAMGIRYSAVPAHTYELAQALNQVLSPKWKELRGIEIVSMSLRSINASEEDEKMIKEMQRTAVLRNPQMAAATLTQAQADAMKSAAANTSTGPMMAFAGMNMAGNMGGVNAGSLYQMGAQMNAGGQMNGQTPQQMGFAPFNAGTGVQQNTAPNAGINPSMRPQTAGAQGWTCTQCGAVNQGKFCMECGAKKPAGAPLYKCDKCGWVPQDPTHPPKFCPECGDSFDENDIQ